MGKAEEPHDDILELNYQYKFIILKKRSIHWKAHENTLAMSIPDIQILGTKYFFSSLKETKTPWRNSWFQFWGWETKVCMSQRHKSYFERAPTGQKEKHQKEWWH